MQQVPQRTTFGALANDHVPRLHLLFPVQSPKPRNPAKGSRGPTRDWPQQAQTLWSVVNQAPDQRRFASHQAPVSLPALLPLSRTPWIPSPAPLDAAVCLWATSSLAVHSRPHFSVTTRVSPRVLLHAPQPHPRRPLAAPLETTGKHPV
ncbi:hypothetical protein BOTBODRAFT_174170 [Botryobasidium botryosum FD-172 SS1]|uniref:Uncharacterized protein n=1 Tax=Botryobasidium botryosum (strain FD-172 SS1) TaxID=930990 RepID=A0A067MSY3_BOTB1|nr:hypothetical protein BOTBODRAFT_174170 [Botryobasidium botryosum FD-172 SS1]